jgi:hypothetical protein
MKQSRKVHSWNRAEKFTHGTEQKSSLMEQSRKAHSWNRAEKFAHGTEQKSSLMEQSRKVHSWNSAEKKNISRKAQYVRVSANSAMATTSLSSLLEFLLSVWQVEICICLYQQAGDCEVKLTERSLLYSIIPIP